MGLVLRAIAGAACIFGLCGFLNLSPIKPPPGTVSAYKGQPLHVVTQPPPNFVGATIGDALTHSYGALYGAKDGNGWNGIPDPASVILGKLKGPLGDKMGTTAGKDLGVPEDDEPDAMAKLAGGTGVVLDVETSTWMADFNMFNPLRYTVTYYGRARLIDAASGKVLSRVACKWDSGDADPSFDELMANKAAGLKAQFAKAADDCTAIYLGGLTD